MAHKSRLFGSYRRYFGLNSNLVSFHVDPIFKVLYKIYMNGNECSRKSLQQEKLTSESQQLYFTSKIAFYQPNWYLFKG